MENENTKRWWKKVKLWEVCNKVTDWTHDTPKILITWIPLIKWKEISSWYIDFANCDHISYEEHLKIISRSHPEYWDILFANIWASIWDTVIIKTHKEFSIKNVALFKANTDLIDKYYLYYSIINPKFKDDLINKRNWAAQPFITLWVLRIQELIIPESLELQKKIALILSNYDDLIENNNRRIQILEQTAQETYKEWFVNFRFPWYEWIKMMDSETDFWEIPEGWSIENLWDRIKVLKWKNITRSTITPWDIPVVAWWISPAYYHNKPNVNWPVITISASGANAGYIRLYNQDIWASDCSYISKDNSKFIYYYFLLLKDKQISITNLQVGSAQPHVYPKDIIGFKVIAPNDELIEVFEDKITPIFHELSNLENQNSNLTKTRDLLLPKLISWEIDVSELGII